MSRPKLSKSMVYMPDARMRKLAERVIKAYGDRLDHIDLDRVLFLREITGKESGAAGICRMVATPYRQILCGLGLDVEWIIEFYSAATDGKSREWEAILMYHELSHIGPDGKIVDHDIEDFTSILSTVGIEWVSNNNLPNIFTKKHRIPPNSV